MESGFMKEQTVLNQLGKLVESKLPALLSLFEMRYKDNQSLAWITKANQWSAESVVNDLKKIGLVVASRVDQEYPMLVSKVDHEVTRFSLDYHGLWVDHDNKDSSLISRLYREAARVSPEFLLAFESRYKDQRSLQDIGRYVRSKLVNFWGYVDKERPDLVEAIASLSKDAGVSPKQHAMIKDATRYTSIGNGVKRMDSPLGDGSVLTFSHGTRANMNMANDVAFVMKKMEGQSLHLILNAAVAQMGRKGEIASHRLGYAGHQAKSLEEVGQQFNVTRERVRQISAFVVKAILSAEMQNGGGPITYLSQIIRSACPEGCGKAKLLADVMQAGGIHDLSPTSVAHTMMSIGAGNIISRGDVYVFDPLLTKDEAAHLVRKLRAGSRVRAPKSENKQVLLVIRKDVLAKLDRLVLSTKPKTNRSAYLGSMLTEDVARTADIEPVDWSTPSGAHGWTKVSLRLSQERLQMLKDIAKARECSKVSLLYSCLKFLVDNSQSRGRKVFANRGIVAAA